MDESVFDTFPLLTTDRLNLVRHQKSNAQDMFQLRTDPSVMKYLDTHPPENISQIEDKIASIRADFDNKKGINWIMKQKNSDEAIGYMSLWRIDKKNHRGEIGYAIKKSFWRKGLSLEAATAVIDFGFINIGLNTIMANTNINNEGSQGLLKTLGFKLEAHFREDFYFDGKYLDSHIFGLTKTDWNRRNK